MQPASSAMNTNLAYAPEQGVSKPNQIVSSINAYPLEGRVDSTPLDERTKIQDERRAQLQRTYDQVKVQEKLIYRNLCEKVYSTQFNAPPNPQQAAVTNNLDSSEDRTGKM